MRSRSGCSRQYSSVVLREQREVRNGNRLRQPLAAEDALLIQGQIQGGLELSVELVALVDVDDVLVLGFKEQGVQVADGGDRLPENLVEIGRHLLGDDGGKL